MPLRTVLFDAGNTLLRMNYGAIADHLASLGVRALPEELRVAEWQARIRLDDTVLAPSAAPASTESGFTTRQYFRFLLEAVGVDDESVLGALTDWRRSYNAPVGLWNVAEPDAAEALALVRAAGLAAAVISNSNGSVHTVLDSLGLGRHLDFVIDSAEVGVEKPDPRIFRLALERAGVEAAEAVYVGDLYSIDVRGARAAGMDAILMDPGGLWGDRGCPRAESALAAVRQLLGQLG